MANAMDSGPNHQHLAHLEGSGYKVAEGDPDVRGWDVMDRDGHRIGEVDDLLIDTEAMKVRYLEVRLDRRLVHGEEQGTAHAGAANVVRPAGTPIHPDTEGLPELDSMADKTDDGGIIGHVAVPGQGTDPAIPAATMGEVLVRGSLTDLENRMTADEHLGEQPYAGERHILVPIGRARLDTGGDLILVDALTADQAAALPEYRRGALDSGYESTIRSAFGGTAQTADEHTDPYDERRFYNSRRQVVSTPPPVVHGGILPPGSTASGMTPEEEDQLLGKTPLKNTNEHLSQDLGVPAGEGPGAGDRDEASLPVRGR